MIKPAIKQRWDRWVAYTSRQIDPRPMALTRILLPMVLLFDFARLTQLGLVDDIYRRFDAGGINKSLNPMMVIESLSPEWAGIAFFGLLAAALACIAAGLFMRPALAVAVLTYAQLGHLSGPCDRGIDRILRMVMLFLFFSEANRHFSLKRPWKDLVPAWPEDLIRYLMVLVYTNSAMAKLLADPEGWLGFQGIPQLYRIVANPVAGSLDPLMAHDWYWLFFLGGWFTILVEMSSPLLLTRYAPYWATICVPLHLGISATMELGMFSWGLLSLYPIFFAPWVCRALDRRTSAEAVGQ